MSSLVLLTIIWIFESTDIEMSANANNTTGKPLGAQIQEGLAKVGEKIQEGAKYTYEKMYPTPAPPNWNCDNWDSSKQNPNFDREAFKLRQAGDAYNDAIHHPTGYDPVFDKTSAGFHSKHDHMPHHRQVAMGVH